MDGIPVLCIILCDICYLYFLWRVKKHCFLVHRAALYFCDTSVTSIPCTTEIFLLKSEN